VQVRDKDYALLLADTEQAMLQGERAAILGLTPLTLRLLRDLASCGLSASVAGVYSPDQHTWPELSVRTAPLQSLTSGQYDLLVVAADAEKEDLLLAALPHIAGTPKVIISGYGHLSFRDPSFHEIADGLLVPSLANGYPHTLPHLYQCLVNAARLGLRGVIAEFGMFKGGTTMFLSRLAERLGMPWPVIGFDTFAGFPPRRSPLDMYAHPGCVYSDVQAVRRYLDQRRVEIVMGDIVDTVDRLRGEDVVLSFIDTDNFTSASAAIDVVQDATVVGGAIVFDHFTGVDRFRYTLGERIAGRRLLDDHRYFHLHGTGVFYRQC
jgi:O-methyltransferase